MGLGISPIWTPAAGDGISWPSGNGNAMMQYSAGTYNEGNFNAAGCKGHNQILSVLDNYRILILGSGSGVSAAVSGYKQSPAALVAGIQAFYTAGGKTPPAFANYSLGKRAPISLIGQMRQALLAVNFLTLTEGGSAWTTYEKQGSSYPPGSFVTYNGANPLFGQVKSGTHYYAYRSWIIMNALYITGTIRLASLSFSISAVTSSFPLNIYCVNYGAGVSQSDWGVLGTLIYSGTAGAGSYVVAFNPSALTNNSDTNYFVFTDSNEVGGSPPSGSEYGIILSASNVALDLVAF